MDIFRFEIITDDMKKKPERPQFHFYFDIDETGHSDKWEYIGRLGYAPGKSVSIQKTMDALIFRRDWADHLDALRKDQRRAGVSDRLFMSSDERKKLGLVVRRGRKSKMPWPTKKAA